MKKQVISAFLLTAALAGSAASPLWLRNAAISPDGNSVAFTYKGNIYSVPVSGGKSTQLTFGKSFNTTPVWSPDGKQIAFASDREGSLDIYIIGKEGGTPKRLTSFSGNETPKTFIDNNTILFSANILPSKDAANGLFTAQTYTVSTNGGRPEQYNSLAMKNVSVDKKGRVLYSDKKGVENEFRKHERSSGTSDIWLIENGKYTKLTDFNGHDLEPLWIDGTDDFYYISEKDGTLNIWRRSLNGASEKQVTSFKNHPVRTISIANNGTLAFSQNGELYRIVSEGTPEKINVDIITDEYIPTPQKSISASGAGNFDVSKDGKNIAFILNGDVYVTSVEYKTTRRITDTPAQERTVSFAPDGRSVVYDSDRDGYWQLFTSEIVDPEEKDILYATEVAEKPLYKSPSGKAAFQPAFSPDGKKVAFLEDRTELKVIDLKSKNVNTALDGKFNYSYSDGDISFEWSPDSKWFLTDYIGIGGWNNLDIALVKADGSEVVNLTESGYSNGGAQWAMDGKTVIFYTGKYGYRSHGSWGNENDVVAMFLDPDAYERFRMTEEEIKLADEAEKAKKKESEEKDSDNKKDKKKGKKEVVKKEDKEVKPLVFDLDNRRYRTAKLTGSSSNLGSYYLNNDGDKLYYVASSPDGRSLYSRNLKDGSTTILAKGLSAWGMIPSSDGKSLFVNSGNRLKKVELSSGKTTDINFSAETTNRPEKTREYIFSHAWQQVLDKFYDADIHGVDWKFYKDEYARFLPYISNNYDFADMLSELLGELNASHTGARYYPNGAKFQTSFLGAFFDPEHKSDGLKVTEILKGGPLDRKNVNIEKGDIILAVNDSVIKAGEDYYPILEGKSGKKVKLSVVKPNGKEEYVYIRPISGGTNRELLYNRWIEKNERVVDSVSNGRVAYVHIKGMNSPSYREVYDRLLGKYRNYEAVVVDTRYNGGGWLHNDVAILLSGKEYVRFMPRGRYIGSEPFSQWNKPSAMLISEANYSDAHGTPFTYKALEIGDLVGAPVPGTMTAVWWETQVDPSIVFGIPEVTSVAEDGKAMENRQLNPDVLIYNKPEDLEKGYDAQLVGATRHLLEKLDKKK